MRRTIVTQDKIIELTRDVIRGFYGRNIEAYTDYLADDFVWIGAFGFQLATSKQDFLDIIRAEMNTTPMIMQKEHFEIISRDRDTFVLYSTFQLDAVISPEEHIQTHTRLSVIWRYIEGDLKLVHIHGSNAQDVPLVATIPKVEYEEDCNDFWGYVKETMAQETSPRLMVRTTTGEHRILIESDIMYLQAEGQSTRIYTKDEVLSVSGILRKHQAKLSDMFYRIHKTYLVNLAYLTALCRYQTTLRNQMKLPVGKEHYLPLKRQLIALGHEDSKDQALQAYTEKKEDKSR